MEYIKVEEVKVKRLVCHHPKVKRIWEYEGCAASPGSPFFRNICLLLEDDTTKIFTDNGEDDVAIKEAEEYLNTL